MPKLRTLWKVTQGWAKEQDGPAVHKPSVQRPESKAKVYDIYVPNNVRNAQACRDAGLDRTWAYDHTDVWCDERDGNGWRLYEHIEHKREGA